MVCSVSPILSLEVFKTFKYWTTKGKLFRRTSKQSLTSLLKLTDTSDIWSQHSEKQPQRFDQTILQFKEVHPIIKVNEFKNELQKKIGDENLNEISNPSW